MRNFLMALATKATRLLVDPAPEGTITDLTDLADKFNDLMHSIVGPIIIVIGAAAAIYAIYLGVLYAKAEDANRRKEVQGRLIGAAIGLVIIIVGITLCYAVNWETIWDSLGK